MTAVLPEQKCWSNIRRDSQLLHLGLGPPRTPPNEPVSQMLSLDAMIGVFTLKLKTLLIQSYCTNRSPVPTLQFVNLPLLPGRLIRPRSGSDRHRISPSHTSRDLKKTLVNGHTLEGFNGELRCPTPDLSLPGGHGRDVPGLVDNVPDLCGKLRTAPGHLGVEEDTTVAVLNHDPVHEPGRHEGLHGARNLSGGDVMPFSRDSSASTSITNLLDIASESAEPGHLRRHSHDPQFRAVPGLLEGLELPQQHSRLTQRGLHHSTDPVIPQPLIRHPHPAPGCLSRSLRHRQRISRHEPRIVRVELTQLIAIHDHRSGILSSSLANCSTLARTWLPTNGDEARPGGPSVLSITAVF